LLVGDIYRKINDKEKAMAYYEKAIHRMMCQDKVRTFQMVDEDGKSKWSISSPESMSFFLKYALKTIARLLIKCDDLQKAKGYVSIAIELFPEDETIEELREDTETIAISYQEIEELKQKLFVVQKEAEEQRKISKSLIEKLIKAQNEAETMDLDSPEDWKRFVEQVDVIILNMETQAKKNKELLAEIASRIKKEYGFLKEAPQKFLITAEALFEIHKGTDIDFACIVIEYVKVCEYQLRQVLSEYLSPNDKMLGNILYTISHNGIIPYNRYMDQLNKINTLRKRSAHTGLLTEQDVKTIKDIYFNRRLLQILK